MSCNLRLRGHDFKSVSFMSISRLLSNNGSVFKKLLLKSECELNYLRSTIRNHSISLLGITIRKNCSGK